MSGRRVPSMRAMMVSLSVLAFAGVVSQASSMLIAARFPDRPMPRDLLFETLPYVSVMRYVAVAALVAGFVLFFTNSLVNARSELPRMIAVFGIMYTLRGGLNALTPLANAHGEGPWVFAWVQNGMFPSGHVAAALLFALLTDEQASPVVRRVLFLLAALVAAGVILAQGHYSIDVAGGALLAYFCEREWDRGALFDPLKRAVAGRG